MFDERREKDEWKGSELGRQTQAQRATGGVSRFLALTMLDGCSSRCKDVALRESKKKIKSNNSLAMSE
jgi:hypothetical protein